jgi:anti-sigma regulatory factor (Ser/Thr protein kinase)
MSAPRRIVRPARMEHLPELVEFAAQGVRAAGAEADAAALHDIRLAVSEVCANVVKHGYAGEPGGSIRIETTATAERLVVRIEDDAPVFDPSTVPLPDTGSDWERRAPGSVGWHLVYRVMDEVRHEPGGERGNVVILARRIGPAPAPAPGPG